MKAVIIRFEFTKNKWNRFKEALGSDQAVRYALKESAVEEMELTADNILGIQMDMFEGKENDSE